VIRIVILISLWVLSLTFLACDNDTSLVLEDDIEASDDTISMNIFFLADIEGTPLNATFIDVREMTIADTSYVLVLAENTNTSQVLKFYIPIALEIGTYPMNISPEATIVHGEYTPDDDVNTSKFVSTSGLFNLTVRSDTPKRIAGNTIFTMTDANGNVDEVTFCEFDLIY